MTTVRVRTARIGPFAAVGAVASVVCLSVPTIARADAEPPSAYTRIVPQQPDLDLAVAIIEPLCADILTSKALADKSASCPDWAGALSFCKDPSNLKVPRPPTAILKTLVEGVCPGAGARAVRSDVATKSPSGFFDLGWQDAVVRGLAAFLVERAKAEALAAAADRFRTGLCKDNAGKRLLPLTCALLRAADPYTVPISWGAVKATAEKDFHELPLRLLDLTVPRQTKRLHDAPLLLYTAIDLMGQALGQHQDLVALLVGLQGTYKTAAGHCKEQPTACALLISGIVSEVIIPKHTSSEPSERFLKIAARVIADRAIALGVVAADAAAAQWLMSLQGTVKDGLRAVEALSSQRLALTTSSPPNAKPTEADAYDKKLVTHDATVSRFVAYLITSVGPQVGVDLGSLSEVAKLLETWNGLLEASLNKDYLKASLQLFVLLEAVHGDDVPAWVGRYLPPLAELAQAQTPEQVKDVLQAITAPVGSYRGKRGDGNRKLTLNGYLGGQGGWEWLGSSGIPRARSFQGGVFAPIGLESSWGFGESSSLGVFLSVIDLGAVASFRTTSESASQGSGTEMITVSQDPQIGLSQVFSPGLYVMYGIPCTPLVLGAGGALAPELRKVTFVGTGATEAATAFRLGAFLAIDVTILPF